MKKVIVGMSGGVDSSVAALALMEAGYDVTGVSMTIYKGEDMPGASKGCYGREATEDKQNAAEICQKLGIPFYVFDCSEEYKHTVLKYFKDEYLSGRTPNPCVRCNLLMKFGLLPKKAEEAGLDGIVCSPLEAGKVHDKCGKSFLTITPGVRFADGDVGDQKRVMTPAQAKEIGSDYIVVGRPITAAADPVAAYERCVAEFCD